MIDKKVYNITQSGNLPVLCFVDTFVINKNILLSIILLCSGKYAPVCQRYKQS